MRDLPTGTDTNGETFLQEAQAIVPTLQIPYANFGGKNGTIQSMLSPFPQYGGVSDVFEDTGTAAYNALQLILNQRTWHGLNFQLNYTYSREKDSSACCRTGYDIPASAITDGIARKQTALDYTEHAPRQVLHTFGTYALPFGKGHIGGTDPIVNMLASGWHASGIYSYTSGSILGYSASGCLVVGQGCNPSFTPGYTKNVRINGAYGHGINALTSAKTPFLDAGAFYVPKSTYQARQCSRHRWFQCLCPRYRDIDGGLSRTFKIKERLSFVFAAQVQNLTNHFSWRLSNTRVSNNNFGTLSNSGQRPRDWQFNGKFVF